MIEELNKKLDILELEKVKDILPDYIHKTSKDNLPLTESLNYLLGEEINYKNTRASEGIIKAANFPFSKTLDDYDFSFQPSVNENQIKELSSLSFINKYENIIYVGNSGVGKTHLAGALGIEAAKHRNSVYFYPLPSSVRKHGLSVQSSRCAGEPLASHCCH